ncbi:hypothetical protein [Streptomyces lavendofoliae]|uniref:hypothetical protein n=1 Tax=Streptomyces lavendofoliae TaxID=67314 RepID=UPI003D8E70F8
MTRKVATGAISLMSLAGIALGTAPAHASQATSMATAAPQAASAVCSGWKNAGSLPLKWSRISDNCAHFGAPGMNMNYSWVVYQGGSVCVKFKGFNPKNKESWSAPKCGKGGTFTVRWGNVMGAKEIQVKGGPALLRWN